MSGQRQKPASRLQGHRERPALTIVDATPVEDAIRPAPPLAMDGGALTTEALARWDEFWTSPVAAVVDMRSDSVRLTRWIQAVNERLIVSRMVAEKRLVSGSLGQPRTNPLMTYLTDLTAEIERAEQHFGMSPLARFRLGIEAGAAALTAEALNKRLNELSRGRDHP